MRTFIWLSVVMVMMFFTACARQITPAAKTAATVTIYMDEVKQTVHSFGASDCWTTKFIGNWSDEQKKNHIADLLFSMDTTTDGTPRGIGLSLWRFNIGGGSFEQGAGSGITTDWRREECFMNADGSYNWNKQKGQQWFLQAARQRGVHYTLGFSITPPVFMTKNGKAFNSTGGTNMNIQDGKMADYAAFLAEVTKHFGFDYLSPVNEPQWTWGQTTSASQEGTQAVNSEIASLAKLTAGNLNGTSYKVVIGEAGQWDFLYSKNTDARGDQVSHFFSGSSPDYIGNLPQIEHVISAHSYFTTCPDNEMVNIRQQVAAKIVQVDASLQAWQTEFGILGNICNQYNGSPRNTGIDYGLYVARVLHYDLTVANVTSWQWWLAVSPYNYSDALVYINDLSGKINPDNTKQEGIVLDSKQLWCFGNYARFIRPGMKRIQASVSENAGASATAGKLLVSAYKDATEKKLVLVLVNAGNTETTIQLAATGNGLPVKENTMHAYTTDALNNLKKSVVQTNSITVPAKSVITLTGSFN